MMRRVVSLLKNVERSIFILEVSLLEITKYFDADPLVYNRQ